jgi:hypothetical protein
LCEKRGLSIIQFRAPVIQTCASEFSRDFITWLVSSARVKRIILLASTDAAFRDDEMLSEPAPAMRCLGPKCSEILESSSKFSKVLYLRQIDETKLKNSQVVEDDDCTKAFSYLRLPGAGTLSHTIEKITESSLASEYACLLIYALEGGAFSNC